MTPEAIAINERFFRTIDLLVANDELRGLKTFATKYSLNQGNLCSVKTNLTTQSIKPEYLTYLVRDFNVSPDWLLLGIEPIFKPIKK